MTRITKLELQQQLSALSTENVALRTKISELQTQLSARSAPSEESSRKRAMLEAKLLAIRTGKTTLVKH